jgi:hypothetical protein
MNLVSFALGLAERTDENLVIVVLADGSRIADAAKRRSEVVPSAVLRSSATKRLTARKAGHEKFQGSLLVADEDVRLSVPGVAQSPPCRRKRCGFLYLTQESLHHLRF